MLASITPLGERGRQAHWVVTITAFVIGAAGAGMLVGALAGAAGEVAMSSVPLRARLAVLALAVVIALVLDLALGAAPGPRRQVNERWLDEFRGWVYGLGYGAQLGAGVTTVVTSAATYVALIAAALSARPGAGALIVGCFGAIRGLTLLAAARVRTPNQLLALHAAMARGRLVAVRGGALALAAIFVLAAIGGIA
ncbi:MAG TPA: hypothetical protein VN880_09640 [Solirubrobacteraceae bacterium]|jgi:hypothetical protein|nr:hypothetical protein [Solirubrobacteraceae bacterium]